MSLPLQPNAVICLLRDRTNGTQVLLEDRPPRHFSTLYSYALQGVPTAIKLGFGAKHHKSE